MKALLLLTLLVFSAPALAIGGDGDDTFSIKIESCGGAGGNHGRPLGGFTPVLELEVLDLDDIQDKLDEWGVGEDCDLASLRSIRERVHTAYSRTNDEALKAKIRGVFEILQRAESKRGRRGGQVPVVSTIREG